MLNSLNILLKQQSPSFQQQGLVLWKINLSIDWVEDDFRMIQENYIYCTLYFYYYYISSTSDHQALDMGKLGTPTLK